MATWKYEIHFSLLIKIVALTRKIKGKSSNYFFRKERVQETQQFGAEFASKILFTACKY